MVTFFTSAVAFLISFCSMPFLRRFAWRINLLDFPGGRKNHKDPTPLIGGVAIYLGLCVAIFFNFPGFSKIFPILLGATLIFVLGLINDLKEIKAQARFICQVFISLLVISMGLRVSFFPPGIVGDGLEVLISIVWLVGLANAFNYLDGLDGLAAGSGIINLFFLAVILNNTAQYPLKLFALVFAFAILGFLPYNLGNKKIFLGESGSTLIGFTLACVSLAGYWGSDSIVKISIPVLILGVPIFDMVFTTIVRLSEGKVKGIIEWMQYGGRDHFHHRLVDLGFKPYGAVLFIYFITCALGISAIIINDNPPFIAIMSLIQAVMIFAIIAALIIVGKGRASV
ncbi:MAG: MraY family glycosyltransferase [Candidatus Omnitrophota bacterium]